MTTDDLWPPRFTIDQEAILTLFTGETFYSNVDASIREAILNAIDAITRHRETDPNLRTEIKVSFDRQSMTVTVLDNGDGMDTTQIAILFAKIGASASELARDQENTRNNAIGEFGIGILSYFLICNRFELHTKREGGEAIGLAFTRAMLDATTQAQVIPTDRVQRGTEIILSVEREQYFERLVEKFPHWMRDVDGLVASLFPGGEAVPQGGLTREVKLIEVEAPDWIHSAHIGPPVLFSSWDTFDGSAYVDVLYKGVFVAQVAVDGFWGIVGAIHVDPKYFRPKLNREGFVGEHLRNELEPVLRACHPHALERAVECVREIFPASETKAWSLHRWVTLWLAVPRTGQYQRAAAVWDAEFRDRKAFRLLRPGKRERDVSANQIRELGTDEILVAPADLDKRDNLVQQAVRILRDSGKPVVQGVVRDSGYLGRASLIGESTGDLLVGQLISVLPTVTPVENIARQVISQESAISVFDAAPEVKLVSLGPDAVPVMPVGEEIWINLDSDSGRKMISAICDKNSGHVGLWIACLEHGNLENAGNYARHIARLLSSRPSSPSLIGPIKRQFMRTLTK